MTWERIQWSVPLHSRPHLVQIGQALHGKIPVERWQLRDLWCLHLYRYEAELRVNDFVFPIRPGYASLTPPNARLEYRFQGPSRHLFAHFKISGKRREQFPIFAMRDLGPEFEETWKIFKRAVASFSINRQRAEIGLWEVLWWLAEQRLPNAPPSQASPWHPALEKAVGIIDLQLGSPLSVSLIAKEAGLSRNHLTRLFRARFNSSAIGYLRRCRAERARHLLTYSTKPIKLIAGEVGIPDLHLFNKTIRRIFGQSPRKFRAAILKNRKNDF